MVAAPGTPAAVCPGVPPILSMTFVPLPRLCLYLAPYGNQGGKHPLTASSGGAAVGDWCKREGSARGLRSGCRASSWVKRVCLRMCGQRLRTSRTLLRRGGQHAGSSGTRWGGWYDAGQPSLPTHRQGEEGAQAAVWRQTAAMRWDLGVAWRENPWTLAQRGLVNAGCSPA